MPTAKANSATVAPHQYMSAPRARYLKEHAKITRFLQFIVASTIDLDDAVREVVKLRRRSGHILESPRPKELVLGAGATRKLSIFYSLLTEMALCCTVDNFFTYLTELLSLVFSSRPETLRSGDQVRLDFVLAHRTRASPIKAIVDRQVNQLSYQGMEDLAQFLSKRLKFKLFPDDVSLNRAILLVETRNIIVHARGIANDTFLRRVASSPVSPHSRIRLTIRDVESHSEFLAKSVANIEGQAHDQFGVKLPYKVPTPLGCKRPKLETRRLR
jgi:hypothetical protein